MRGEIIEFFIGRAPASRVFPYTSFVLYRFLRALQQNTAQSRLVYLLIMTFIWVSLDFGLIKG